MGFLKSILAVVLVAWLGYNVFLILKYLRILACGQPVFSHAPGPCKIIPVTGCEDSDVLPNGLAVISSGVKQDLGPKGDPAIYDREGNLYAFDFNKPDQGVKELVLENYNKSNLNPLGLDLYTDPITGETTVFVVNLGATGKCSIEIFQFDQETLALKHKRTVIDKNIFFPNNVVGVGSDSFYITNTNTNHHYFSIYILKQIEKYLGKGNVVFYDGTQSTIVDRQIFMADGINVDKTGKYVFVSSAWEGEIYIYKRNDNNSLERQQVISVGTMLDNLFVDENGNIWTGHSDISMVSYSQNFSRPCTSKVLQVKLSREENGDVPFKVDDIVEAYSTKGENVDLKGASSGTYYKGKLLIGTVFSNLMYCDVLAL